MPMKKEFIIKTIRDISDQLVKNWPLYSFVTSNPLSGLEDRPFEEAIRELRKHINISGYPSASAFEQALDRGFIDAEILNNELSANGISLPAPDALLKMKELEPVEDRRPELNDTDRNLIKWLSVFLDQGSLEWPMPYREEGFYKAWKKNARYDHKLPKRHQMDGLPDDAIDALEVLLASAPEEDLQSILKYHLLALPGWTGYIKYRMEANGEWQNAFPITHTDYLAVRLSICSQFGKDYLHKEVDSNAQDLREEDAMKSAWLRAMELTYRKELKEQLSSQRTDREEETDRPEAQMVFCIDTRSERIRRAVEQSGRYETFGYAGFFGVAMDYHHPEKNIFTKSCPPILDAQFDARESLRPQQEEAADTFHFYNSLQNAFNEFRFTLKNNIPASFGYVESSGFFYGVTMILRTLFPTFAARLLDAARERKGHPEWFNKAELSSKGVATDRNPPLSVAEKTTIAKAAFDLMGWESFAPLVVFAGHGSQTANNPFGSSLDCGACAGNKGRHNARVLADICNEKEIRTNLSELYDIQIPEDTLFVAAEHNTTSNAFEFFDQHIPESKSEQLRTLKADLLTAQHLANLEQFELTNGDPKHTHYEGQRRTSDWAETRPEWGLAGNASFIIGSRSLSSDLDLKARSFLHSYEWEKDPDGTKLEAILLGPMVVTQWINNHYYFAATDNDIFGSGSKTTHNVTGKFGVVQGNGGDLKSGLPLESLREDDTLLQHFPLRLSVFIHAPQDRVQAILEKHPDSLNRLVQNEWIHLSIIDPTQQNAIIDLKASESALADLSA